MAIVGRVVHGSGAPRRRPMLGPTARTASIVGAMLVAASCTVLVRVSTTPTGGVAHGASWGAALDEHGEVVAFATEAADLVPGDTNGVADVVVRDSRLGTTERVSVATGGGEAHGPSTSPSVSADGSVVAFASDATDLVPDDTNGVTDVFVHDRRSGRTERVSLSVDGRQLAAPSGTTTCRAPGTDCRHDEGGVAISDDGRHVVFVGQDPDGERSAVLVRDRTDATTEVVALGEVVDGAPRGRFAEVAVDGTASVVAATEESVDPVSGEVTHRTVRVVDTNADTTTTVDHGAADSVQAPDLSADGRWLALTTTADVDGVEEPGSTDPDVVVLDRTTGTTERASRRADGTPVTGGATHPTISDDGNLLAWSSPDPVFAGPPGVSEAVVADRSGGGRWTVSRGVAASPVDATATISPDGRMVAVESAGTGLDLADDRNGASDVFVVPATAPVVTGAAAALAAGGPPTRVTITGRGFRPDTEVVSLDPDVRVLAGAVAGPTSLELTVVAHPGAVAGAATLQLTNRGPHGAVSTTTCDCLRVTLAPAAPAAPDRGADLIVIVTDDQRADAVDDMPLVDGRPDWARFERSYVELPMCCPARATFLTGQGSQRTGVDTLWAGPVFDESETVATRLDAAGYRTALIGKYLNGYPFDRGSYTPPGWDRFLGLRGGYTDYELHGDGTSTAYGSSIADYSTDVLSAEARAFLRDAEPDEPVLLFLTYNAPHFDATGRVVAATRDRGSCAARTYPPGPSFGAHDTVSEPAWMAGLGEPDPAWTLAPLRHECEALASVDEGVDALFDELERLGRLDGAYVVFTSDNGYAHGEHRLDGKGHLYEESVRVPLLVRGPGVVPGPVERLTSNIDLTPTLLDWAGLPPEPAALDGTSYAPTLRGDPAVEPTEVLLRGCRTALTSVEPSCGGYYVEMPPAWGLRTDRYKYVEYATGDVQLFDLEADPHELTNLAPDPAMAATASMLHDRLVQRRGW